MLYILTTTNSSHRQIEVHRKTPCYPASEEATGVGAQLRHHYPLPETRGHRGCKLSPPGRLGKEAGANVAVHENRPREKGKIPMLRPHPWRSKQTCQGRDPSTGSFLNSPGDCSVQARLRSHRAGGRERGQRQVSHNRDITGPQDQKRNTQLSTDSKEASTPTPSPGLVVAAGGVCREFRHGGKGGRDDWSCLLWVQGRQEAAVPGLRVTQRFHFPPPA